MRQLALAAALAALPVLPAAAEEIPGSQFQSGFWDGAAYTDDTGAFMECSTWVGYQDSRNLWVRLLPDDTISIYLNKPDVTFKLGDTFELWVMMETGLPAIGTGDVWNENYAGITYKGIQPTVDFLTSGRYLRMLGMGIDDGFDVDGIGPALAMAQDCLAQRGGTGVGGKVLGSAPGAPKAPPKVPDLSKPKTSGVETGGGLGTRPGGKLGTPAPKPQP